MIVRSEKYPCLVVSDVAVRFVDGEAEVTDKKVLDRLRRLSDLGVVVPAPVRKAPAKKSASSESDD